MAARIRRRTLGYLFCAALIALLQSVWLYKTLPTATTSRDISIALALNDEDDVSTVFEFASQMPRTVEQSQNNLTPSSYCEQWAALSRDKIDCRSALRLDSLTQLTPGPDASKIDEHARFQISASIDQYRRLEERLHSKRTAYPSLQQPLMAVQSRRYSLERALVDGQSAVTQTRALPWFETLLLSQGQRYSATDDRFRDVGWDIARLLDQPERFSLRGKQTAMLIDRLPVLWLLGSGSLLLLVTWRIGPIGLALVGGLTSFLVAGTSLTFAASVYFGEGTSSFPLNPLGNQALRQGVVLLIVFITLSMMIMWSRLGHMIAKQSLRHPAILGVLVGFSVLGTYTLSGPAMGSEVLKCGVSLLAATTMAGLGRLVYAAQQFVPALLAPRTWLREPGDSGRIIAKYLGVPLVVQIGLMISTLIIVAGFFHDLGGVLVATLVGLVAIVLVFGARFGALLMVLFGIVGTGLLMTDKLKDRLALMQDPWTASVSDFARLEAYSQGSGPWGYGINPNPWCSGGGACLPLQVLSDYMPVLLKGALGSWVMIAIFLALCLGCVGSAAWAGRRFLLDSGESRLLSMAAFYLLIATLLQAIITFFGNWRWIPLTGLGTPLLSIGISSVLAPVLAVGLLAQVEVLRREDAQL
jgi:cell division protein FtsW (lipid II flippase)